MRLAAVPILRIFDEELARDFYVGYLGMQVDWEHRFEPGMPVYMQVSRDGLAIHLTGHHGATTAGTRVYVEAQGFVEAYHAELAAKDYPAIRPGVEETPWGTREMTLTDPFGNRLTFGEDLPAGDG